MKRRILAYLAYVDKILQEDDRNWDREIEKHLVQIAFFAHERLVHLIVTVLFALMTIGSILYCNFTGQLVIVALVVALLLLMVPYIMHYYLLENSVQQMYRQYDRMLAKKEDAFLMPEDENTAGTQNRNNQ